VCKAAYCALLWPTHTRNLSGREDAAQQEHLDGDGEDEDEGERDRGLCRHDRPQSRQAHHLDAGEQVHAQRAHLKDTDTVHENSPARVRADQSDVLMRNNCSELNSKPNR